PVLGARAWLWPRSWFRPPRSWFRPPRSWFRPPRSWFRPPRRWFRPPRSWLRPPRRWFRAPRRTVRLRLTLVYGARFLWRGARCRVGDPLAPRVKVPPGGADPRGDVRHGAVRHGAARRRGVLPLQNGQLSAHLPARGTAGPAASPGAAMPERAARGRTPPVAD